MSIENPTPGGSFGGDGAATTGSARNPGGQFSGIGRLGVEGRGLSSTILWIGPEPPTGDGFLLWINTSDGRWYGYWNDGTSSQWVDLSLPFGEGLQGPQGIEGPRGEKGDVGQGIPAGGVTNEILVKLDGTDYNTAWGARPADGLNVLNGTVDPTTEGVDGEFYINTTSWEIFGPKTAGAWGTGTSIIGPTGATGATGAAGADGADGIDGVDGNTIIYGVVDPTTEGVDGDTYINTATNYIFYNKSGGVWPAGVPLVVPLSYVTVTVNTTLDATYFTGHKVLLVDSASPVSISLATGLAADKELVVVQEGAGQVTILANGTTLLSPDSLVSTRVQQSQIVIVPTDNTDEFRLGGDLA